MAVRKNPDWHVWIGDGLYWIRTPPGIYIFIIFVLLCSLAVALNRPRPITYSVPTFVNPVPLTPPQQVVAPPNIRADNCSVGMVFVQHLASCVPGHRRTINVFVAGTKNDCPDDAIFIDRLGRCIPMYSVGNYTIFAGDVFYISNRRDAYVYVRSGQIQIYSSAANFNKYKYPSDQPTLIRAGAMITGIGDSSSIRIEFDAAPH